MLSFIVALFCPAAAQRFMKMIRYLIRQESPEADHPEHGLSCAGRNVYNTDAIDAAPDSCELGQSTKDISHPDYSEDGGHPQPSSKPRLLLLASVCSCVPPAPCNVAVCR